MAFVNLILDTDLGSDCDDVGALAVLHALEKRGEVRILCATHCSPAPGGAACLEVINRYYGRGDIPVGRRTDADQPADPIYDVYGSAVAEAFFYDKDINQMAEAVDLLRQTLAAQPDGSVTLAAIGSLYNIARLLTSPPDGRSPLGGAELVERKVKELVIMGGCFADPDSDYYVRPEFNIKCDIPAARRVAELCPVPTVFSGYEIGQQLITGSRLYELQDPGNPVWYAYYLHRQFSLRTEGWENAPVTSFGRPSWDQSTVLYAVRGAGEDFVLSPRGRVEIDAEGVTRFTPDPRGLHRFIRSLPRAEVTRMTVDGLMLPEDGIRTLAV